jgi:hypothetical protein
MYLTWPKLIVPSFQSHYLDSTKLFKFSKVFHFKFLWQFFFHFYISFISLLKRSSHPHTKLRKHYMTIDLSTCRCYGQLGIFGNQNVRRHYLSFHPIPFGLFLSHRWLSWVCRHNFYVPYVCNLFNAPCINLPPTFHSKMHS